MRIGVIDIGGTFIKSGVFADGTLTEVTETPTNSALGGTAVMRTAMAVLEKLGPVDRIGVSTAGQVDTSRGIIKFANPNIPDYTGTNIRGILSGKFGVPVYVENDVNAAATGEAFFGAGAGVKDFLCLTFGTGIGGAIYANGELYSGSNFSAGEVGHLITHADKISNSENPFLAGAYETHASTTALIRDVQKIDPTLTNGRLIFAAIDRPEVKTVIDQWIGEILCGLASLIYTFNPRLIILGGGVMSAPYVIQQLRLRLSHFVSQGHLPVDLQHAQLGNRAGLMGAGYLALTKL